MHIHKTGALLRAAVLLGAACGTALDAAQSQRSTATRKAIGLAFQVVDDMLDVDASTATLGKTAGKDCAAGQADLRVARWASTRRARLAEELRERGARGARRASARARTAPARARRLHRAAKVLDVDDH